jgi:putative peptidoglycan lipid II flippase
LLVIAQPVISVMFERGAFGAAETAATYPALMAFAAGLPAFVLVKVLAPIFYAHEDTKTPFKIATLCVVVNLAFNLLLMGPLEHVGMALATTIAGWVNVAVMCATLLRRDWLRLETRLWKQLGAIATACILMAATLHQLHLYIEPELAWGQEYMRFALLIGLCAAGAGTYFGAALITNTLGIRTRARKLLSR